MACAHSITFERYATLDDGYGGETSDWESTTESTMVDLDLHRYQCTQCREIFYYSGRAKEFHENGIASPWIKGLE